MDPNSALRAILEGGTNAGVTAAGEYARALNGWLKGGGFAPRVEIHPACDAWMQGDRYGSVVKVGTSYIHLRMERSGRVLKFAPRNILHVL